MLPLKAVINWQIKKKIQPVHFECDRQNVFPINLPRFFFREPPFSQTFSMSSSPDGYMKLNQLWRKFHPACQVIKVMEKSFLLNKGCFHVTGLWLQAESNKNNLFVDYSFSRCQYPLDLMVKISSLTHLSYAHGSSYFWFISPCPRQAPTCHRSGSPGRQGAGL